MIWIDNDIYDDLIYEVIVYCIDMLCYVWIFLKIYVVFNDILRCKINNVVLFIICKKMMNFIFWWLFLLFKVDEYFIILS